MYLLIYFDYNNLLTVLDRLIHTIIIIFFLIHPTLIFRTVYGDT